MHWLVISQQNKIGYYTYTCLFICDVLINFCGHFLLYLSIYPVILFSFNCIIKRPIFLDILENLRQPFSKSSPTFPGKFTNIPRNLLQHSWNVKIITLTGILLEISWNCREHSPHFPHSLLRSCIPGFINSLVLII